MELIFLGTSSGTPTKTRNLSGVALKLQNSKYWHLFDCGEATQHQLLKTPLSLLKLRSICITHIHGDHCYGLLGLLASASMDQRKEELTIIAPTDIKHFLDATFKYTQLNLSFSIQFIAIEEITEPVVLNDFTIDITELSHRVPSYAFTVTEKNIEAKLNHDKLVDDGFNPSSIWNKIQKREDVALEDGRILIAEDYLVTNRTSRIVTICGDNDNPELLKTITPVPDVIVHESTYTDEVLQQVGIKVQHSSAKQIAEYAESVGLKNLILTHFSARYQNDNTKSPYIDEIYDEAKQYYSGNLFLANDFDVYQLNKYKFLQLIE